jgi:hypothetical protein
MDPCVMLGTKIGSPIQILDSFPSRRHDFTDYSRARGLYRAYSATLPFTGPLDALRSALWIPRRFEVGKLVIGLHKNKTIHFI